MCSELCIPRQLRGLEGDCGSGIGQLQLHQPPIDRSDEDSNAQEMYPLCVCARVCACES